MGTTYGVGNGTTTFNLPDARAVAPRGVDNGRGIDSGRVFGSEQLDQMQRITGSIDARRLGQGGYTPTVAGAIGYTAGAKQGNTGEGGTSTKITFDSANSPSARTSSATSGETRMRNIALLACIKY